MADGTEYDLGPGLVPLIRAAKVPKTLVAGESQIVAKDANDAQRVIDILEKRGFKIEQGTIKKVREKAPITHLRLNFDATKLCRSLSKTALTAACVLYGNDTVRKNADKRLLVAAKEEDPDIKDYAGWDYRNPWPTEIKMTPHKRSRDLASSGFEHAVYFADVSGMWVAYISLFGDFRFSVRLGSASRLRPSGLAVNPRGAQYSRFECTFRPPGSFLSHHKETLAGQFPEVSKALTNSINAVMSRWKSEARSELDDQRDQELAAAVASAGDDPIEREEAIGRVLAKWLTVEHGKRWEEELDSELESNDTI
jgi:hypothetical protein